MKLETGMYVRTNEGIGTIHKFLNNKLYNVKFKKGHIKKWVTILQEPSFEITDLLMPGDVITFYDDDDVYKVICIPDKDVALDVFYLAKNYDGETEDIIVYPEYMKKHLRSIVTKEQFERDEYII